MEFWQQVEALQGVTLRTLDRNRAFSIINVDSKGVIVSPLATNKPRTIRREELDGAYKYLIQHGRLERTQIRASFSQANPAYVAAILSRLSGIKHRVSPITLFVAKE